MIPKVCQWHRTVFDLDFEQPLGAAVGWRWAPRSSLMAPLPDLASMALGSSALRGAAQAALAGKAYAVHGERRLLVYATYVWGEDYVRWLPAFIRRFREVGVWNLIVFGDQLAHAACETVGGHCVELRAQTGLHRYTIPLVLMNMGCLATV